MENNNEQLIVDLAEQVKNKVGLTEITTDTIHVVLKEAMELIEELKIPGSEKRDNVLNVVKAVVNDLVKDDMQKQLINDIINNKVLENTMDLIIDASKEKININNKKTQRKIVVLVGNLTSIVLNLITMCLRKPKTESQIDQKVVIVNNNKI